MTLKKKIFVAKRSCYPGLMSACEKKKKFKNLQKIKRRERMQSNLCELKGTKNTIRFNHTNLRE